MATKLFHLDLLKNYAVDEYEKVLGKVLDYERYYNTNININIDSIT